MSIKILINESIISYLNEDITNSQSLKHWFNGSKIVDSKGNPLPVYHGSDSKNITKFRRSGDGIWFSDNIEVAEARSGVKGLEQPVYSDEVAKILNNEKLSGNKILTQLKKHGFKIERFKKHKPSGEPIWKIKIIDSYGNEYEMDEFPLPFELRVTLLPTRKNYSVFLNIKNPLVVDAKEGSWDKIIFNGKYTNTMEIAIFAENNGYDGVIFQNLYEFGVLSNVFVVYNSEQIRIIQ